jgi:hypothetical protein
MKGNTTGGRGFAECSTRQSPLGKIFLGKGTLPSAFYRGTQQNIKNFCRVLGATLGKIFSAVTALVINNILPSACPNKFCRQLGHLAKCFFIFF